MSRAGDEELALYLLQLLQALRFERRDDSHLAAFLVHRALQCPALANFLHWYLVVECEDQTFAPRAARTHAALEAAYRTLGPRGAAVWDALTAQTELMAQLGAVARDIIARARPARRHPPCASPPCCGNSLHRAVCALSRSPFFPSPPSAFAPAGRPGPRQEERKAHAAPLRPGDVRRAPALPQEHPAPAPARPPRHGHRRGALGGVQQRHGAPAPLLPPRRRARCASAVRRRGSAPSSVPPALCGIAPSSLSQAKRALWIDGPSVRLRPQARSRRMTSTRRRQGEGTRRASRGPRGAPRPPAGGGGGTGPRGR